MCECIWRYACLGICIHTFVMCRQHMAKVPRIPAIGPAQLRLLQQRGHQHGHLGAGLMASEPFSNFRKHNQVTLTTWEYPIQMIYLDIL